MVEVHQAVAIAGHGLESIRFIPGQDVPVVQFTSDFLVFGDALPKGLREDVPAQVEQGFEGRRR